MKSRSTTEILIIYITSKSVVTGEKKTVKTESWICTLQAGRVTPFCKAKW